MRRWSKLGVLAGLCLGVACATPLPPPPPAPTGPAAPVAGGATSAPPTAPADGEWERLVAAARQEGRVVCGCPPVAEMRTFLTEEFQRAYPGMTLEYTGATLPQFPARVEVERAAGQYLWDTYFWGAGQEMFGLADRGVFEPIVPALVLPENADPAVWGGWDQAFLDREKQHVFAFRAEVGTIAYNAKAVPASDLTDLKDLLEPRFKGKIVWWDPRVSSGGSVFGAFFLYRFGEDAFRRLLVDQEPVLVSNNADVAERVVRGPQVIGLPTIGDDLLKPYLEAGVPIELGKLGQEPEHSYQNVAWSNILLFNRAPHPAAAKLFVNWLLSRQVQTELAVRLGHNSRRTDVPAANAAKRPLPGVPYFLPQSEEAVDEWQSRTIELAKRLRPS